MTDVATPVSDTNLRSGDLVGIVDDNGCELDTLGIYMGQIIPADIDIGVSDIIDDLQFVDQRFSGTGSTKRHGQFFYAVPEHWHYVLLVGDRILYLNTNFYSVTKRVE